MFSIVTQPIEVKALISTSDEAKQMGRWDAEQGFSSQAAAYAYADENSIHGSYLRGDYTLAYVVAKGL